VAKKYFTKIILKIIQMKNLITLFALAICLNASASDYYWVGGTGNYSDVAHWATTSGGSTFQVVPPTIYDDVIFDVNSFLTASDTVYFDIDYTGAHAFFVSGTLTTPTFASLPAALRLDVQGNFYLQSGVNWSTTFDLAFTPFPDSVITIQTNGVHLSGQILMYGDASTIVTLSDNFSCSTLTLEGGVFYTMNHNITCTTGWHCWLTTIYFGTSTVTSAGAIDWLDYPILFNDSATFIGSMFDVNTGITGLHFGKVIIEGVGSITAEGTSFHEVHAISIQGMGNTIDLLVNQTVLTGPGISTLGPNTFHKVIAERDVAFSGNTIVDTLMFTGVGCNLGFTDTLTIAGELIMNNTPASRGTMGGIAGIYGWLNKTSGIVCVDFVDFDSVRAIGGAQFFAGSNSAMVNNTTTTGWQFTGCVTAGGVWPGDANYDLSVNNLDILAIGIASGETGPMRGGASLSWVEQAATDWTNSFSSGVNMKHADCDGNGVADASDTTAVSLNYGLHHPASRVIQPNNIPSSNGVFSISVSPDTVGPSSPVHVEVDLTMDSIYGVAFSIYYNPQLVDGNSLIPDFSNTWLGTNGVNMIGFAKVDQAAGRIDFALTRTDHTNALGGTGTLLMFDLITQPTIPIASALTMETNNVNGVYSGENYEVIAGSSDSTFVDSTVSVNVINSTPVNLSSAFIDDQFYLTFYAPVPFEAKFIIYDNSGRLVYIQDLIATKGTNRFSMHLSEYSEGIFVMRMMNEKFNCVEKVVHQKRY
jgi:hypothetical protein